VVSSVNGSRLTPPVDPVGDKTVERARRDFMDAVRSSDRQIRHVIETIRDETDRAGSDPQPVLRRNPERLRPEQGPVVHLETARSPERAAPGRNLADGMSWREAGEASLRRQETGRRDPALQDHGRQDAGRQDIIGRDSARQEGVRQEGVRHETPRPDATMVATRASGPTDHRGSGLPPTDPVVGRIPTARSRPEPIGPSPPPGYRPPPPVAPEGTVLIGPVPGREALNLVGPISDRAGAEAPFDTLRLSSTTPREVAERIAGFMETGTLDTSPVRFAPVPAVLSNNDADAEPDEARQQDELIHPDPAAERSVLADLENDTRVLAVS